jgi:hypothetical protein
MTLLLMVVGAAGGSVGWGGAVEWKRVVARDGL